MRDNRASRQTFGFVGLVVILNWTWAAAQKAELKIQTGHNNDLQAIAFSPDSRWLATASYDQTIKLWEIASGRELRTFVGHNAPVLSVAFSPDGRWLISGDKYGKTKIWETNTGQQVRTMRSRISYWDMSLKSLIGSLLGFSSWLSVNTLAVHPQGEVFVSGSSRNWVKVWEVASGRELKKLKGHSKIVSALAFSADGRWLATGASDAVILWETEKWRTVMTRLNAAAPVAFSPAGRILATMGFRRTIKLWNPETGKEIRTFQNQTKIRSICFSPDGNTLAAGGEDRTIRIWQTATGKELLVWKDQNAMAAIRQVLFSPDGHWLASFDETDKSVELWDPASGRLRKILSGGAAAVTAVTIDDAGRYLGAWAGTGKLWDLQLGQAQNMLTQSMGVLAAPGVFSTNGKWCAYVDAGNCLKLYDQTAGRVADSLSNLSIEPKELAVSSNGESVVVADYHHNMMLWNVKNKLKTQSLHGHLYNVFALAYSPMGRLLATGGGSGDGQVILWEAATGQLLWRQSTKNSWVGALAFSQDGRWLVSAGAGKTIEIWEVRTGKLLRSIENEMSAGVEAIAFSPDGRWLASGFIDNSIKLWDVATGQLHGSFAGHVGGITVLEFSHDNRWLISGSWDGTTRLWDLNSGKELCTLAHFSDGSWAVVDSAGRYDASNDGDLKWLYWVAANEPIELAQLKELYYEPGLLAKVLGFNAEPLRSVQAFKEAELYPEITVTAPAPNAEKVGVHLKNRGGGIGQVAVFINGKEIETDARASADDRNKPQLKLQLDIANHPFLYRHPDSANVIEIKAFNGGNYLASRNVSVIYKAPGAKKIEPPRFWGIVAGVSDYHGDQIDLRFAAKDAVDIANALAQGARRLFGADRVDIQVLSTAQRKGVLYPSKRNVQNVFHEIATQAKSTDILVVYLAGHGVNYRGKESDYYYLTADAQSADLTVPAVREAVAFSSQELTELIKQIPALKQVLILDTCAAGRLVEILAAARNIPSSQIRALERMKDRTGMHILAGAAADAVSYEASRFDQGLLTYSLLLGMRGAALRDDEFVDISKLFQFSADQVPELAKDIGGIQRPLVAAPRGGTSFDIGRLLSEDKSQIPLAMPRRMILRANFQDEERFIDRLNLTTFVNNQLRELSARGREAQLIFVDAVEFPEAYSLAGRYRTDGDKLHALVRLFRGEQQVGEFTVVGNSSALEQLAADILLETEKLILTAKP